LGFKKLNKEGYPAIVYIHPRDLDLKMPRISEYAWHYYWRLKSASKKFESLLKSFEFSSVRDTKLI